MPASAVEVIDETVVLAPEQRVSERIDVTYNASVLNGLSYSYEVLDWGTEGHEMQFNIEWGKVEDQIFENAQGYFNEQNYSGETMVYDGDAYNFIWANDNPMEGENFTLHYRIEYKYEIQVPGDDDTTIDDDDTTIDDDDTTANDDTPTDDDDNEEEDETNDSWLFILCGSGILVGLILAAIGYYFFRTRRS
jgi:hypothetical protein